MLYNRQEALNLLGKISCDLNILRDREFDLNQGDFDDLCHKLIFSSLQNLAIEKDIIEADGMLINSYLSEFPVQHEIYKKGLGVDVLNTARETCKKTSLEYSYKTVKKFSLLRRFQSIGMDVRELYDEDTLDVIALEQQRLRLDRMSIDEIKQFFKTKLIEIDQDFQTKSDAYSFRAGTGLEDLIERCKKAEHWGLPFQSKYYNTTFHGMIGSKFMIRSGGTGSGKTRLSISDMCNIAVPEIYSNEKKEWIRNDNTQDVVFISTELTDDEVHLCMMAVVSGVPEEIIKEGKYTEEQEYRINRAIKLIQASRIHCEYNSNYSIAEIENVIEKNIIRHGAKYIFFDYIQITQKLAQELNKLFGYVLREDQMLNQLSTALKNLANKYDVFILSSTQLNRSYKTDQYLDVTSLRGGMATADKADYVIITMKVTKADMDKLQYILEDNAFQDLKPTHGHHIVKNRGGKWVGIIVWLNIDLDTMETKDCFVTTQDYEKINNIVPIDLRATRR